MHISFYAQFMALHYSAGLQINAEDASSVSGLHEEILGGS